MRTRTVGTALLMLLAVACSDNRPTVRATVAAAPLSELAQIGGLAFEERLLSSSSRMSCATCHDPAFFHGPPNTKAVQVGGPLQEEFGVRTAPSLRYLERQPPFDSATLRGGLMADGRADTLANQAHLPWFSTQEFGLADSAELVRRLRGTVWGQRFFTHFGENQDHDIIIGQLADALAAFMREDSRMHPYDSKFDQVAQGRATFSAAERRGHAVFRDPARGNCASCHPDTSTDGLPPLFTDFRYAAQGLPRNADIPANANPAYFDMGLCGPQRTDLQKQTALCGMFRTPGLRNVAVRPRHFHNGAFQSLADVVEFYNTRDTHPARWYPQVDGVAQRFNDLPAGLRANVTHAPPFGVRATGEPAMNAQEVSDLLCFLDTLTDGYRTGIRPRDGCGD